MLCISKIDDVDIKNDDIIILLGEVNINNEDKRLFNEWGFPRSTGNVERDNEMMTSLLREKLL